MGRGTAGRGRRFGAAAMGALVVGLLAVQAGATRFDHCPENCPSLDNRKIEFTWSPDDTVGTADRDPVYSGNTVLKRKAVYDHLYPTGTAISTILANQAGDEVFTSAPGQPVRRWRTWEPDSVWEYPLGSLSAPTCLSLHGSGLFLLGGTPDGEVVMWDLRRPDQPALIHRPISTRAVLGVQFFPSIKDTLNLKFVTVTADDTLRVWDAPPPFPGDPARIAIAVPNGVTGGLAMTTDLSALAVGTRTDTGGNAEIRIWDLRGGVAELRYRLGGPDSPPEARPTAAVGSLAISRDQKKLVSADASGGIVVWNLADGLPIREFNVGEAVQPIVDLMPPFGRIVFTALPDGKIQLDNADRDAPTYQDSVFVEPPHTLTAMRMTPDGAYLVLGDSDGQIQILQAGICRPTPEDNRCFGGYMVWRSPTPDARDAILMRIYNYSDSTWTFKDPARTFCDPDSIILRVHPPVPPPPGSTAPPEEIVMAGPTNGVPFYYSVTRFDTIYLAGSLFPYYLDRQGNGIPREDAINLGFYREDESGPPTPLKAHASAREDKPLLGGIRVVPNPYEAGKVGWEQPGQKHVEFQNLPARAVIRIYNISGERVRIIEHAPDRYNQTSNVVSWDLKNEDAKTVASGVYVYQVESPSGEVVQGYFAVIL